MSSAIASTPTGRSVIEAARERRVGAPVYLRYATEITFAEDLLGAAAAAAAFATQVLGAVVDLYAVAAGPGEAAPGDVDAAHQLALTLRHVDGSVALLGIGRRPAGAAAVPPNLLLLGDRGVVEGQPPPALPGLPAPAESATSPGTWAPFAEAIRRSLRSGQPVPVSTAG